MAWATPHPFATRIETDAGRPALIGSRWVRKQLEDDPYDEVVIRGVFEFSNDHPGGSFEVVVSPASFGPAVTASGVSLAENYKRLDDDTTAEDEALEARLTELAARTAS